MMVIRCMPQQRPPPPHHRYRRGGSSATIAIDAVIIASSYMPLATNNDFMVLAVGGSCVIGHVAKTVRLTDLDARELAKEPFISVRAILLLRAERSA